MYNQYSLSEKTLAMQAVDKGVSRQPQRSLSLTPSGIEALVVQQVPFIVRCWCSLFPSSSLSIVGVRSSLTALVFV